MDQRGGEGRDQLGDRCGELAVIPAWVRAPHRQVAELNYRLVEFADAWESVHGFGQLAAVGWVTGQRVAPMTQRAEAVSWALARAESWCALSCAAGMPDPTARDWAGLGVAPRPVRAGDADFAHGAWRALAWMLGVRPDPPALPADLAAPGAGPPGSPSADWRSTSRHEQERNMAEARRWWHHIRSTLDGR
jgi:hypothetical protein